MVFLFFLVITLLVLSAGGVFIFRRAKTHIVPEDTVAITNGGPRILTR